MKKALKDIKESSSIAGGANDENIEHLTQLLLDRKKQYDLLQSIKDKQDVIDLNKEIDNFNSVKTTNPPKISSFMNREKVLDELDELTEEMNLHDDSSSNDTDNDDLDNLDSDIENENEIEKEPVDLIDLELTFKSYVPCCAHNSQLVLKDGLKLDEAYSDLIKRISKDIVSKPKVSLLIAEQLRNLEKTLKTYVITRWNSILFMIKKKLNKNLN